MASKFQNRLVGTLVLVALGVIILPDLLDGEKKHYQDEFAAIPLVPKPGEDDSTDALPPTMPPLNVLSQHDAEHPQKLVPPPGDTFAVEVLPEKIEAPAKLVTGQEPPMPQKKEVLPAKEEETKSKVAQESKFAPSIPPSDHPAAMSAPVGQAYIVQLGALRNTEKVHEIVAKLRLSGYDTYTVPNPVKQGEMTRIFVGPEVSRERLQQVLPELNRLSGLDGQIRHYNTR